MRYYVEIGSRPSPTSPGTQVHTWRCQHCWSFSAYDYPTAAAAREDALEHARACTRMPLRQVGQVDVAAYQWEPVEVTPTS